LRRMRAYHRSQWGLLQVPQLRQLDGLQLTWPSSHPQMDANVRDNPLVRCPIRCNPLPAAESHGQRTGLSWRSALASAALVNHGSPKKAISTSETQHSVQTLHIARRPTPLSTLMGRIAAANTCNLWDSASCLGTRGVGCSASVSCGRRDASRTAPRGTVAQCGSVLAQTPRMKHWSGTGS
jgi:hypothetical protein